MATAVFVDTNVLVYADDLADPRRQAVALDVLSRIEPGEVVLSSQVLSEYANVLTHPAKCAKSTSEAVEGVRRMMTSWRVVPVDAGVVIAALEARERWGLSYYDAQIWAAAARNAVALVLTEDFADGLVLGPVRFADPFASGFDLDAELARG
ncbi:MAG TPA: PIN domain-containing protein [Coriobacteriia bacterium]